MTDTATEAPLKPLPLTAEQIDVIHSLFPQAFLVQAPVPPPVAAPRVVVRPVRDSRLESLLCLYAPYKDEAAAADAKFTELKKAIGAELEALFPEDQRPSEAYEVPATSMYPQLTFQYRESRYLPAGKIKEFLPAVYTAFHGVKRYWELRESAKGTR